MLTLQHHGNATNPTCNMRPCHDCFNIPKVRFTIISLPINIKASDFRENASH